MGDHQADLLERPGGCSTDKLIQFRPHKGTAHRSLKSISMVTHKKAAQRHMLFLNITIHNTLTQCWTVHRNLLLILFTVQIQVILKIMGRCHYSISRQYIVLRRAASPSILLMPRLRRSGGRTYHIPNYATRCRSLAASSCTTPSLT